eukprot:6196103-Pleurochrysis_carterae.AAC.1
MNEKLGKKHFSSTHICPSPSAQRREILEHASQLFPAPFLRCFPRFYLASGTEQCAQILELGVLIEDARVAQAWRDPAVFLSCCRKVQCEKAICLDFRDLRYESDQSLVMLASERRHTAFTSSLSLALESLQQTERLTRELREEDRFGMDGLRLSGRGKAVRALLALGRSEAGSAERARLERAVPIGAAAASLGRQRGRHGEVAPVRRRRRR